jgi:hypothetical protein
MSRTVLQRPIAGDPRRPAPSYAGGPQLRARRRALALPVAVLVIVMAAAAAGAGTWFAIGHARAGGPPVILPASSPASVSSSASASAPAGSAPASAPPAGLATLAPAAALYPGAVAIEKVIDRYFQAINSRDYAAYLTTQSPDNVMTASQFQAGFESTRDSDVLITGITSGFDGRPAADVTFTSRQQPHDGPDGESCTNWHVTMYFDGSARTYTIGAPPNGYKAAYQACSS